ncbi:MAG: hypothetical protein RR359_02775 [Bacilli bacterium]
MDNCKISHMIYKDILNIKSLRDEKIRSIYEEYDVHIDNSISQLIPFKHGDIIKDSQGNQDKTYIYKGIKYEAMILMLCDKDGSEIELLKYHWSCYSDFNICKEIDDNE